MAEDHGVNIKISAEGAEGTVGKLKAVQAAVLGVRSAVNKMMMAFGVVTMAIGAVTMLWEGIKKLQEWMNRAAKAAAELNLKKALEGASTAMQNLVGWQQKYNNLLKQELASLAKAKTLRDIEDGGKKEVETAQREIKRTQEMSGVTDPRRLMELKQRYRIEDEAIQKRERVAAIDARKKELDEEESVYSSKARVTKDSVAYADKQIDDLGVKAQRTVDEEQRKQIQEQIDNIKKQRKALQAAADQYDAEAKFRRDQIAALDKQRATVAGAPSVAAAKNEAETKEFNRKEAEKAEEERKKNLMVSSENEFVKAYEKQQEEDKKRQVAYNDSLSEASRVQGNRLTAMGLGAGISGSPSVDKIRNDLAELLKVSRAELEEVKSQGNSNSSAAVISP